MARFRYQHIKSSVEGKAPTAAQLKVAEIGVNDFAGDEKLFIKNSTGDVVDFPRGYSREYIDDNERVIAEALNDLNSRKLDASAYTPTDLTNYYTKSETSGATELSTEFAKYYTKSQTSGATEISTALNSKVDTTAFTNHTGSSVHMTTTEKTNLDSLATNIAAISGITSTKVTNWDTAYTNNHTHSNKSALDAITGNVGTMAYENTSSYSSATQVNSALANKLESSDIADFFDDAKYEDSGTSKVINFYHGNTIKATINADDFIKDGMIDSVSLETTGGTTYLVITWNTDAGKSQTSLNVGDLFDADNYYTKAETSGATELATAFDTINVSIEDLSGQSETVAAALNELNGRKLDASAYTPTDLSNYYTKSETSGATELQTAFNGKTDTAITTALNNVVTAHTANTNIHLTTTEKGQLHTHTNKTYLDGITGTVGTMAYENASSYSSATQVNTALGNKVDKTEYATFSAATNTSIDDLSGQSETIAVALNDLNNRKLDASAYTPVDLNDYYTKEETDNIVSAITDTIEDNEKVVATALNYLNNTIEDNEKVVATALNYLNKVIETHTVVSAVTVNTNLSNVTCPTSITSSSNNGAQATVIYENEGSTNDYTVSVSTSYNTPDGSQLVLTCPKNGYCEVNYLNVNGNIYARGV